MGNSQFFQCEGNSFRNVASTGSVKKGVLCGQCQKTISGKHKTLKNPLAQENNRPPSHPLRSPFPAPPSAAASGGLSLSLSLSLSNDSARRGASTSGEYGCIQTPRKKQFETLGRHLSFSSRSAGFEVFVSQG